MTRPRFCNKLTWIPWKVSDQLEVVLIAAESEEPFICLLLYVMGKAADLGELDRGQIVRARKLGTSIFETAQLVGCS